jgi:hypothetical protein
MHAAVTWQIPIRRKPVLWQLETCSLRLELELGIAGQ